MPVPRGRPRIRVAPCRYCHKQFKRQEHLQRHERIHTHEKPFECDCGQRFSRRDLLARHQRVSHQGEEAPGGDSLPLETAGDDEDGVSLSDPNTGSVSITAQIPPLAAENHDGEVIVAAGLPATGVEPTAEEVNLSTPNLLVDPLLGPNGSPEFEFLWDDTETHNPFLPIDFFDTDFSIVDISQQYAAMPFDGQPRLNLHAMPELSSIPQPSLPEPRSQSNLTSRLPSLEPVDSTVSQPSERPSRQPFVLQGEPSAPRPWKVSPDDYLKINEDLNIHRHLLPYSFVFPSRHTLSRFLEGYFRGFHDHMPFLHTTSFCAAQAGPELVLALAAVGALYRFEHAKGYELYRAAQSVITWKMNQPSDHILARLASSSPGYAGISSISDGISTQSSPTASGVPQPPLEPFWPPSTTYRRSKLRLLQSLVILMALTSWGDRSLVRDSLGMSSQVAMLAREVGIGQVESPASATQTWEEWAAAEERRRTLFVCFILTSLQSIAFNVPPAISNQEVALDLPAPGAEWRASTAAEWTSLRDAEPFSSRSFRLTLENLVSGVPAIREGPVSAFGNYALIHGLLQQIFYARQASSCLPQSAGALSPEFTKQMEGALRAWQESWEATRESTLDPSSPKGPLGFNSTALLRLAYIRLNTNIGPNRQLITRDPRDIAAAFLRGDTHVQKRSPHLDRAVLQCIHALSIPVRVGIAFVARTQTLNWSIQHALCNLECAFLLRHWLQAIAQAVDDNGFAELGSDELKLLNMVASLVRETDLRDTLDDDQDHGRRIRRLAASTIQLWAETFKGFHVFEMVHVIGAGLSLVAETMKAEFI